MQFTRAKTVKYIIDMTGELQKMADKNGSPVLSYLLKMAQMEGKNELEDQMYEETLSSKK